MTTPLVQFAIGMIGLSWAIAYAWWCVVRVVNFRQDILDIRDRLFDAALSCGGLDDPAHRAAREHLNKVSASADCFSLWVVGFVLGQGSQGESTRFADRIKTKNPKLAKAIETAVEQCAARMSMYLLRETTPGLVLTIVVFFARLGRIFDIQMISWSRRVLLSDAAEDLECSRGKPGLRFGV